MVELGFNHICHSPRGSGKSCWDDKAERTHARWRLGGSRGTFVLEKRLHEGWSQNAAHLWGPGGPKGRLWFSLGRGFPGGMRGPLSLGVQGGWVTQKLGFFSLFHSDSRTRRGSSLGFQNASVPSCRHVGTDAFHLLHIISVERRLRPYSHCCCCYWAPLMEFVMQAEGVG